MEWGNHILLIIGSMFLLFILYLLFVMIFSAFNIFLWPIEDEDNHHPKLSYKQFIDYYWINPDKWILRDNYVQYKYLKDIRNIYYNYSTKSFSFSFIDQFKYQKFKHDIKTNKEKMERSKAHKESYRILLEGVQKDIYKLRKQSEDELNQAMSTMKEVKERIG